MGVVYGPFLDEEFFSYHNVNTTLGLDALEIFHADLGYIGFNDLEKIYDQGRKGNFDQVMFSGVATLLRTSHLCERGFKNLLKKVEEVDPTMNPEKLHKYCKQEKIKVELQCQLALMPVCYLTRSPANSIVLYSKNLNNLTGQRRYIVNTFHTTCFRRSELTLQRYMVLKFIIDACTRYRNDVDIEDRDIDWLVKVYLEEYAAAFTKHQRPRLHRSEVYDHFATHVKWLSKVFSRKAVVDRAKWEEWHDEVKRLRKKAKRAGLTWGTTVKRPVVLQSDRRSESQIPSFDKDYMGQNNDFIQDNIPEIEWGDTSSEPVEESSTESDISEDGDVHYTHDPSLLPRAHAGLLKPMPLPTWYWSCDIKDGCPFVIDIGYKRNVDAPCMAPLSIEEKDYLRASIWGLYDKKLGKIWKKMCQAHMDWHWREVGLVLDHNSARIYAIEEDQGDVEDN